MNHTHPPFSQDESSSVVSIFEHLQLRLERLAVVAMLCRARGGGFDVFYRDYLTPGGAHVGLNPFRDRNGQYSKRSFLQALRVCGFGTVPELAANVFWQEATGTVWEGLLYQRG